MQVMMSRYVPFIALWCLALNTYIVFSSGNVKALEKQREKKDGKDHLFYYSGNDDR